jgi:hypothetical protein
LQSLIDVVIEAGDYLKKGNFAFKQDQGIDEKLIYPIRPGTVRH